MSIVTGLADPRAAHGERGAAAGLLEPVDELSERRADHVG
jgi:hypothetical protein